MTAGSSSRPHPEPSRPPAPWTPEQWQAITRRDRHLLVSAAAGSGKTAVLAERVIHRITEGPGAPDIDRLLVVTFTEAAAAQMRERIGKALEERLRAEPGNARLQRQLALLPRAPISTLHAFCRSLLRRYFYRLDLDPRFRILDEQEARLLQYEVAEEVLEAAYESAQPGDPFFRLAEAHAGPAGDARLVKLVLEVYAHARSLPDPKGWLQSLRRQGALLAATRPHLDATPWAAELREVLRTELAAARSQLEEALALAASPHGVRGYLPALEDDIAALTELIQTLERPWDDLGRALAALPFGPLGRARPGEGDPALRKRVQELRGRAKAIVKEWHSLLFTRDSAALMADAEAAWPQADALLEVVERFDEAYARAKASRSAVDFNDLEHLCLKLLADEDGNPSPVARELQERFTDVLVDEYQDINQVQEALLNLVSRPPRRGGCLFLVGDVKQSIYRFRQADPTLFLTRAKQAEAGDVLAQIHLSANFRSRRTIVDAVNFLFRQIMVPPVGEMTYAPEAELVYRAGYPPLPPSGGESEPGEPPVEVHLLERSRPGTRGHAGEGSGPEDDGDDEIAQPGGDGGPPEDDLTSTEREAMVVARRIREMLEAGTPVWDRERNEYRPVRLRDMAVLMRATRYKANALVDILARCGIPAYAETATGYFAAVEVETMLALLSLLDNPRQDIPLAAVLRSPIVGLDAEDLAAIRTFDPQGEFFDAVQAAASAAGDEGQLAARLRIFLERLERWRTAARRGPLSRLIWQIYRETGYLDYAGAMPGGRQRRANLQALYERARQFDAFDRPGLSRFLRFIESLQETEGDLGTPPAAGEGEDVVRVMSVHGAKGLEFPIVFVVDMGREFKDPDDNGGLVLFHRDLGIGSRCIDEAHRVAYETVPYWAVRERKRREELAEEMRVLYVALTRSRERLILVGSVAHLDRACVRWVNAAKARGERLEPDRLAIARSWLDWLGPALCRHPAGEPLRRLSGETAVPLAQQDPSRWDVRVYDGAAVSQLTAPRLYVPPAPAPWPDIAALRPLPDFAPAQSGESEDWRPLLEARLRWQYPYASLLGRPAKVAASELKRRWAQEDEESAPAVSAALRPFERRPRFQEDAGLSPAERGTATHLVIQHLSLTGALREADIRAQVSDLAARGYLTPLEAEAVDCGALAAFFASPLGLRLRAGSNKLLREVPFTLAIPARDVYPDLSPDVAGDEFVLTQGIIDCLLPEGESVLIIDFKTDDIPPEAVLEAARRYAGQMRLYRRAVKEIFGTNNVEAHLVFLSCGRSVPVGD